MKRKIKEKKLIKKILWVWTEVKLVDMLFFIKKLGNYLNFKLHNGGWPMSTDFLNSPIPMPNFKSYCTRLFLSLGLSFLLLKLCLQFRIKMFQIEIQHLKKKILIFNESFVNYIIIFNEKNNQTK